jgi:hypothetical protein
MRKIFAGGMNLRGVFLLVHKGAFRRPVSLQGSVLAWEGWRKAGDAGLNRNDRGKCLKIRGRRARKELGMPITDEGARSIDRRGDADLNQDDDGGGDGHRRHRMHGDAESAMVGVAGVRVEVRDLGYGQEGHEDEAHDHDSRGMNRPESEATAMMWVQSCQVRLLLTGNAQP